MFSSGFVVVSGLGNYGYPALGSVVGAGLYVGGRVGLEGFLGVGVGAGMGLF